MVVGDCLRIDKNDTALGGSVFLNHLVVKKFLPRIDNILTIFNSTRRIFELLGRWLTPRYATTF